MAFPQPTPSCSSSDIRKAEPRDLAQVSRTLAYAFHDDPVMTWVTPDDLARRQALPSMFELVAEALAHHDETYTTENGAGVALWVPSGQPPVAEHDEEAFGRRLEEIAATTRLPDRGRLLLRQRNGAHRRRSPDRRHQRRLQRL